MNLKLLLITLSTILVLPNLSQAACSLNFKVNSPKAKTYHLNGTSFSNKQLEALRPLCNITISPLSKEEKIQQFIDKLEAKELKAGK